MRHIFILTFSFFSLLLVGQTVAEGEAFFNSGQYEKARQTYKALLDKKPNHALNNYRYARCCYELNLKEEAIAHFRLSDSKMTPLRNYFLGNLYFDIHQFDNSVDAYKAYLAVLNKGKDKEKIDEVNKKIQQAQVATKLIKTEVEKTKVDVARFENKAQFIFTINDSLTYNQISQFKSPRALQLYIGLHSMNQELDEEKKELEELRKKYAEDQTGTVRMELAPQILALERSIKQHITYISEQTLEIRNEEIKYINKNK